MSLTKQNEKFFFLVVEKNKITHWVTGVNGKKCECINFVFIISMRENKIRNETKDKFQEKKWIRLKKKKTKKKCDCQ